MKQIKRKICILLSVILVLAMFLGTSLKAFAATTIPANANLLNTYGNVINKVGTSCVAQEILDKNILKYAKKEYNSMTVGNEMKPDYILGWRPKLISIAEAKQRGYYIPDNYPESTVPALDFSVVDNVLKTCYENGLSLRGHTLVWHSQTPDWYFRNGYNGNSGYVNQAVMNKRLEYYIKSYMGHVCSSKYSGIIYAWDVVNEFLHAQNSGWQRIYGNPTTDKKFIKDAFQYAYDTLAYFKMTDKVKLFYNDYNTYMEVNDVIKLINYINSDRKVCAGIGMQSHLGTDFPSVSYYKQAIDAFRRAGFEIQITEMDVSCTNEQVQAQYYYDIMSAILAEKKLGANITALVWWGLCDKNSWLSDKKPLLYSNYTTKKPAYDAVLKAYFDAGYSMNGSGGSTGGNTGKDTGDVVKIENGWYSIKNVNAEKYLQVENNQGKNSQNVELRTKASSDGQKWYLENVGNGYFTLKSALGNYMLDVNGGSSEDGTNIQIYGAHKGTAQQFAVKKSSKDGAYIICTKSSNLTKVLDDFNNVKSDGANVCQWTLNGQANQQWVFEKVKAGEQGGGSKGETPKPDSKLKLDYTINNWGSGYQVSFKISNNSSSDINGWTLKLKKNEVNIDSSWNINIAESGDYYIITPVEWNKNISKGNNIEFGMIGKGSIGKEIYYCLS